MRLSCQNHELCDLFKSQTFLDFMIYFLVPKQETCYETVEVAIKNCGGGNGILWRWNSNLLELLNVFLRGVKTGTKKTQEAFLSYNK